MNRKRWALGEYKPGYTPSRALKTASKSDLIYGLFWRRFGRLGFSKAANVGILEKTAEVSRLIKRRFPC
jgi:hypothetical protein